MIGGYSVSTTRLLPTKALRLSPKIMKIFLPLLQIQWQIQQSQGDVESIMPAATTLLESLDEATLNYLYRELLAETSIVLPDEHDRMVNVELSSPDMIDMAFGGLDNGMSILIQVMVFAAEVNFKRSFFDLTESFRKKTPPPATETPSA